MTAVVIDLSAYRRARTLRRLGAGWIVFALLGWTLLLWWAAL